MSDKIREPIECPFCGREGESEAWSSVNVTLNPELREKVLNNEIFMHTCPHCGKVFGVRQQLVYHDMDHAFMIFFDFERHQDGEPDIEIPDILASSERKYKFRTVYGLNEFKEKILILELGLDDIAVERMKYMISHVSFPYIAEKGYKLFFESWTKAEEGLKYGKMNFFYEDTENQKIVRPWFDFECYYEQVYACKYDPRMSVSGNCPCVDRELMENILTKG